MSHPFLELPKSQQRPMRGQEGAKSAPAHPRVAQESLREPKAAEQCPGKRERPEKDREREREREREQERERERERERQKRDVERKREREREREGR